MAAVFGNRRSGGAAIYGPMLSGGTTFAVGLTGVSSTLGIGSPAVNFGAAFAVSLGGVGPTLGIGSPSAAFTIESAFAVTLGGVASTMALGSPVCGFEGSGIYLPTTHHPRRLVVTLDPRLQGTLLPGSGGPLLQPFPMSPGAKLDFEWDWRAWLDDDRISSYDIAWLGEQLGSAGNQAIGDGVVRTWLTLHADAPEQARAEFICTVTTALGRVDSRKFELLVKQL